VLKNLVGKKEEIEMFVQDKIADMLTRIRNANQMKYQTVEVIGTKMTLGIAEILKEEGYIAEYSYEKDTKGDKLTLTLKYGAKKERVITGLKRISKSGLRVYVKADEIPRVLNGLGIAIISTSEGLMTDKEARSKKLGGEVLAYIW
jgi:Ribosomal protein S8